jgi:hypothetical protein
MHPTNSSSSSSQTTVPTCMNCLLNPNTTYSNSATSATHLQAHLLLLRLLAPYLTANTNTPLAC